MSKFAIHLTADYEVFGNGSGDVTCCLIEPAEKLMTIAEQHGTRVTFFVDVSEVWAFEKLESSGVEAGRSQPASRIRAQLQDAVGRGHDIQLHVHPQWVGAAWDKNEGAWTVRLDRWRIGSLPEKDDDGNGVTAESIIAEGVAWLEQLARPVDRAYKCLAFRAGAWSIQPERAVLEAFRKAGISVDSTVSPGAYRDDGLSYFDFRKAPSNLPYWHFSKRVDRPDHDGDLLEIPIFTVRQSIIEAVIDPVSRKLTAPRPSRPPGCKGESERSAHKKGRIQTLFNRLLTPQGRTRMLDYCALNAKEMIRMIERSYSNQLTYVTRPVVAIGHPKNFANPGELELFLAWCQANPLVKLDSIESLSLWRRGLE